MRFPSNFLWGASLSSYQCEGANLNSDWYFWEKEKGLELCGLACDHYHHYDQDFRLARSLNLKALRISIEWSRICPYPEVFSQKELQHYSSVIDSLLKHNLKPVVTLHHFTNPLWFSDREGWLCSKNIDSFLEYLRKTVETLKDRVDTWIIFNEPLVYAYQGFITGSWPPGERSFPKAKKVLANILEAYCRGYEEIKQIYGRQPVSVSLAKHLRVFEAVPGLGFPLNSIAVGLRDRIFNWQALDYLAKRKKLDFIGLNYYCREYVQAGGLFGCESNYQPKAGRKNHLGWDIYPQGFLDILVELGKYKLPVMITENGTAETEDRFYQEYLLSHLKSLAQAQAKGVDVAGYFWWSLLDNFEWDKGFKPRFGLFEVDYKTLTRISRPFAQTYAKICQANRLEL
ncbi:MAG: glycoside hydrolase family 1 protein [Candidatus Omnitrophica bacterium]|nr:glycoside hydrolase family 1 protein [Candidatus Omnitrophota bacterium]